jgi:NhaP-type Na+/H+ or K+/H+ antiporter
MYTELAILALFIFSYSLISGPVEKMATSGPIIFVVTGLILGPVGLGWFSGDASNNEIRVLADITLSLVLFIDAANANLSVLKQKFRIPSRMLLFGLPGVILLGSLTAAVLFTELSIFEAAILGTILAATDAALGKAVIVNKAVPSKIRESLNIEGGLNDGLCVPILFVFIALAEGVNEGSSGLMALRFVVQELGIGIAVGLGLAVCAAGLIRVCWHRGWLTEIWMQVTVVSLAIACFSLAQSLHGSGYIAAFVGGLFFGHATGESTHKLVLAAEGTSEALALMTWLIFGAAVIGQSMSKFTWEIVIYAFLSLTIIRMLPIYISLTGTGESILSRLFLSWFGPRGLASIVFMVIVLNKNLPGGDTMAMVVVCTVFFSLVAHGISANPLAKYLAKQMDNKETQ